MACERRQPESESRWRFVPRQATYLAAHRVPGRAYVSSPRHRYRGPLGDQITSMEARFYFHPENPQVRLSPHVRPIWARESDPFPPALSRGVQRDSLGPRIRNCRNTSASGWELESQISPCVDIVTDILLITVVYWKHSSSVRGMSVLKNDYALGQHAVPVSLELA